MNFEKLPKEQQELLLKVSAVRYKVEELDIDYWWAVAKFVMWGWLLILTLTLNLT